MSVYYAELTPTEFRERRDKAPIAYVPLGTLEWHGEHLPLGADGIQSQHFFAELAQEVGGIVLPMLFLGPDREIPQENGEVLYGMDHCRLEKGSENYYESGKLDGSCYYVKDDLFLQMIEVTALQLKRQGFRILVMHGHGPSTDYATKRLGDKLTKEYGFKVFNCWGSEYDSQGMGIQVDHAAMNETSLVMAFRPELVHMEYLPKEEWPRGVGGKDPRLFASEEMGKEIVALQKPRMVKMLKAALAELE